jgi:hypothetical protein
MQSLNRKKTKRLFILFGVINTLITNIILQLSLLILPIVFATSISQFTNLILGYYFYGTKVFMINKLNNIFLFKYFLLSIFLWFLNFSNIELLVFLGLNKNTSAIINIPFLAVVSYLFQKKYVFQNKVIF